MKAKRRTGTLQVTQSRAGQEQISRGTGAGRTDGPCSPLAEPIQLTYTTGKHHGALKKGYCHHGKCNCSCLSQPWVSSICIAAFKGTIYRSSWSGSEHEPSPCTTSLCHVDDEEIRPSTSTKADSKGTEELTASRLVCLQGKENVKPRGRRAPFMPM